MKIRELMDTISEAMPPYIRISGRLASKDSDDSGAYHIEVADQKVEVDEVTFDTLSIGEELRVRCTRTMRAIDIDRVIPQPEETGEQ